MWVLFDNDNMQTTSQDKYVLMLEDTRASQVCLNILTQQRHPFLKRFQHNRSKLNPQSSNVKLMLLPVIQTKLFSTVWHQTSHTWKCYTLCCACKHVHIWLMFDWYSLHKEHFGTKQPVFSGRQLREENMSRLLDLSRFWGCGQSAALVSDGVQVETVDT